MREDINAILFWYVSLILIWHSRISAYCQGLNFNCVEGVIPTCTSESDPPLYEPMSCGDCELNSHHVAISIDCNLGCQLRFSLEEKKMREKLAAQKSAPSAVVIAA
jgi:hypothetical protein